MRGFAAETRRVRLERGFTREELAMRSGVHANTIGMLERGERDLCCVTQTRLLAALGCDGLELGVDELYFCPALNFASVRWRWLLDAPPATVVGLMGSTIRAGRSACGLSLGELAKASGLHRNSIWNFEKGLVAPNGYSVYAIFRALNLRVARAEVFRPGRPASGPRPGWLPALGRRPGG